MNIKVSDSIIIKPGILDPDFGTELGGWQGRIVEIGEDDLICIEWDSLTLKQMPDRIVERSEQEGFDWSRIWLDVGDVEIARPRDTPQDTLDVKNELEAQSTWLHLGEQGRRIQAALKGVDEEDDMAAFAAWERHLRKRLRFPFVAEVFEYQEVGPIRAGDRLRVLAILGNVALHGVIVEVRRKHLSYQFPLADLEVIDKDSPNYQFVDDYSAWFANR
jgi:hypothetical protein